MAEQELATVRVPSALERHIQTGIQTMLVLVVAWVGSEIVDLGRTTAVLEERLKAQGDQISEMRKELRTWSDVYYKQADAARDLDSIKTRIDTNDSRITRLEAQMLGAKDK